MRSLTGSVGVLGGWIEERVQLAGGFEPGLDERAGALRVCVKQAHAYREDVVVGLEREPVDDRSQPLAHVGGWCRTPGARGPLGPA